MNDSISSPSNQTETPEDVNPPVAEKKKSFSQELAVAPKVTAIVNLLLQLKLCKKFTGLKTKKEKR